MEFQLIKIEKTEFGGKTEKGKRMKLISRSTRGGGGGDWPVLNVTD